MEVAPGCVDVHSLHEQVVLFGQVEGWIALEQLGAYHLRPLVHHGLVEESFLPGQALLGVETAVLVLPVGKVFLVARHHEEGGRQGVEAEVKVASEHGVEHPLPVAAFGVRLLLLDGGLEQQLVRFDEDAVSQSLGAITQLSVAPSKEVLLVGGDAVFGLEQVVENHFQRVAQPVGEFWYMYE